jgi:SAM-dependent methyltransferase
MQCPLCHRTNTSRTRLIDVGSVIDLWSKWFQTDIRPELQGIAQIELWRCVDCSIDFFAPQCLAGSAQMYSQLANCEWYYMARKWEYEAALVDLRGRQRILEIGCGSGSFMALAKEEGGLFVEGLEQNPRAVSEATRRGGRSRGDCRGRRETITEHVRCHMQLPGLRAPRKAEGVFGRVLHPIAAIGTVGSGRAKSEYLYPFHDQSTRYAATPHDALDPGIVPAATVSFSAEASPYSLRAPGCQPH